MTPTRDTCKGVLQLEATFIEVKKHLHRVAGIGLPFQCSDH